MPAAAWSGTRGTNSILQATTDTKEVKSACAREKNVIPAMFSPLISMPSGDSFKKQSTDCQKGPFLRQQQ